MESYFMKSKMKTIGILGLWHLGCVYSAAFAKKDFTVTGADFDDGVVNKLKKNIPPIFEPKLEETLKKYNHKNLHFSLVNKNFFQNKDYIFITYDIPVNKNDVVQMGIIQKIFKLLAKYLSPSTTVVICSQVPIGTSRKLLNLLKKNKIQDPKIIYFPENLRLGQAFTSFLSPDRVVLGSSSRETLDNFKKDFAFFNCPFVTMSLESAEMAKHALNSYLATCISFTSELSDLSEKSGASMADVVNALKMDKRVSLHAPINPGLGFAGGTLGRDIQTLRRLAKVKKYQPKLLDAVYSVNQDRKPILMAKIHSIYPSLKGKSIGILGLTYRPNTNTLRRSMSLELIKILKNKGCTIKAFDPAIQDKIEDYPFIKISGDVENFFQDLDLIILMTEWPEFKNIDAREVASSVKQKVIIDTKNFLDKKRFAEAGFTVFRIGES